MNRQMPYEGGPNRIAGLDAYRQALSQLPPIPTYHSARHYIRTSLESSDVRSIDHNQVLRHFAEIFEQTPEIPWIPKEFLGSGVEGMVYIAARHTDPNNPDKVIKIQWITHHDLNDPDSNRSVFEHERAHSILLGSGIWGWTDQGLQIAPRCTELPTDSFYLEWRVQKDKRGLDKQIVSCIVLERMDGTLYRSSLGIYMLPGDLKKYWEVALESQLSARVRMLHCLGVIHYDLHFDNILMKTMGHYPGPAATFRNFYYGPQIFMASGGAFLNDFGLSKLIDPSKQVDWWGLMQLDRNYASWDWFRRFQSHDGMSFNYDAIVRWSWWDIAFWWAWWECAPFDPNAKQLNIRRWFGNQQHEHMSLGIVYWKEFLYKKCQTEGFYGQEAHAIVGYYEEYSQELGKRDGWTPGNRWRAYTTMRNQFIPAFMKRQPLEADLTFEMHTKRITNQYPRLGDGPLDQLIARALPQPPQPSPMEVASPGESSSNTPMVTSPPPSMSMDECL